MDNSTTDSPVPGFNPFTQNITFLAGDGVTPIKVSIAEIDDWRAVMLGFSISIAVQIGATLLMFIVILLLTQPQKRTTPLFFLNAASLLIATIENTLILAYYPSEYTEFYTWFSFDTSFVPRYTLATNIAANTLGILFLFAIEASLLLQTSVICETMDTCYRFGTMLFSLLVALVAVGFYFAQAVMNNMVILDPADDYSNPAWGWIGKAVDVSYTFSIWFFCVIFVSKLVVTMWKRKKMGMKQWGPMQIICIMGGCTMIIPSIFSVLEFYAANWAWEPARVSHTLVAIMLPLSSIWASASLEGRIKHTPFEPDARRKQFFGSFSSTVNSDRRTPLNSMAAGMGAGSRKGSATVTTPLSPMTNSPSHPDLENGNGEGKWGGEGNGKDGGNGGSGNGKAKKIASFFGGGGSGSGKGKMGNINQVMVERSYSVRSSIGLSGIGRD